MRQQAQRCMALAGNALRRGMKDALEGLAMELMDEARAIEKERIIPPIPSK
jgi:hypothetical protein